MILDILKGKGKICTQDEFVVDVAYSRCQTRMPEPAKAILELDLRLHSNQTYISELHTRSVSVRTNTILVLRVV